MLLPSIKTMFWTLSKILRPPMKGVNQESRQGVERVKSISILSVALILVVAVAATAARAQPVQAASVAFRTCIAGNCQPAGRIVVAQTEFEANLDALAAADARDTPAANMAGDGEGGPVVAAFLAALVAVGRVAGIAAVGAAAAAVGTRAGDWVADRIFGERGGGAALNYLAQANLDHLNSIFDPVPVR